MSAAWKRKYLIRKLAHIHDTSCVNIKDGPEGHLQPVPGREPVVLLPLPELIDGVNRRLRLGETPVVRRRARLVCVGLPPQRS